MKILILWDQFGEAPIEAYLIEPKDAQQRERLMAMHEQFVNSTRTPDDNPVYKFSSMLYDDPNKLLERYKVDWPIKLHESVTIIHCGFLP